MQTFDYPMSLRRVNVNSKGTETLRNKQSRFARMIALLIIFADARGYEITFGDAYAKTGHMTKSLHYSRLAFDLNLFKEGTYLTLTAQYQEMGEYWESIGGSWGGRFNDGNHFSLEYQGRR